MTVLLSLSSLIDRASQWLGQAVSWLTLLMIGLGAFNAIARFSGRFLGFDLSSNLYIEAQWYLFGVLFLLGAAETLRDGGHVRVDVLYARLSPRSRHTLDLAGTVLLLLPFCAMGIVMSLPGVENSWAVMEQSPDPGGLPRYPIKTIVPIAFSTVFMQGCSQCIKHVAALTGRAPLETPSKHTAVSEGSHA